MCLWTECFICIIMVLFVLFWGGCFFKGFLFVLCSLFLKGVGGGEGIVLFTRHGYFVLIVKIVRYIDSFPNIILIII